MNLGALVVAGLLLVANGFFVAVEFALIASRRTKLEPLALGGSRRARLALEASRDLSLQLAGAQLGITMASLGLGAVAEPAVAHLLESAFEAVVDLPSGLVHTLAFVIALTIVVFLHMVVGEMVPKNIAIAGPERTLLQLAVPNRIYLAIFRPAIRLLNGLANAGVRMFGVEPRDEVAMVHSGDELAGMLAASREEGLIEDTAHDLLSGALDFGERPVSSVVVPRDEVVAVPRQATVDEAEHLVVESGHSRLPVLGRDIDDIIGFVHAKDLLTVPPGGRERPIPLGRIRRMLVLPGSRPLDEVLVAMRRSRTHLAVVVDDARRTVGIATLEDVIEHLVGDIRDESDSTSHPRRPRAQGPTSRLPGGIGSGLGSARPG